MSIYNSIGRQNKGVLNNKKVLSEVLKTSGQLAAQYKNNPELLGKAVTQAQKLGMTLEQTKNISSALLNFEDSISAELEAELLTGQDLNLENEIIGYRNSLKLLNNLANFKDYLPEKTKTLADFIDRINTTLGSM